MTGNTKQSEDTYIRWSMNMKDAIQVYAESLQFGMPNTATTKLMNVKYAHCEMYKMDDDDEESYLIQLPYTMNQMEIKHQ